MHGVREPITRGPARLDEATFEARFRTIDAILLGHRKFSLSEAEVMDAHQKRRESRSRASTLQRRSKTHPPHESDHEQSLAPVFSGLISLSFR